MTALPSTLDLSSLPLSMSWVSQLAQRVRTGKMHPLDLYWQEPAQQMIRANLPPDPWQAKALASKANRLLFLCSRQSGKSTIAAALALRTALLRPPALVLILSPTLRQSGELFRHKLLPQWRALGSPEKDKEATQLSLELANGSRIISLPENEEGIRGYSGVAMLVIDEASRVEDPLYNTVRPMLATSGGRLVALSTPFGQRGWFFDAWENGEGWERYKVTADMCPRISKEFLEEEKKALGARWFEQEYLCNFAENIGAVFSPVYINQMFADDLEPLE